MCLQAVQLHQEQLRESNQNLAKFHRFFFSFMKTDIYPFSWFSWHAAHEFAHQ